MANFEVILPNQGIVMEGPHWDGDRLWMVDIPGGKVFTWHPETKHVETVFNADSLPTVEYPDHDGYPPLDKEVGFAIPCESGGAIFATGLSIRRMDADGKNVTLIGTVDEAIGNRLNDAKCDPQGRLWADTMGPEVAAGTGRVVPESAALYRYKGAGSAIERQRDKVHLGNGLGWTADQRTMFFVDSTIRKVHSYRFDPQTGDIGGDQVFLDMNELEKSDAHRFGGLGLPDGVAVDADDHLWIAHCFGSCLTQWDVSTGQLLQRIPTPVVYPTSVCFGGPHLSDLYVTSLVAPAHRDEPLAGSVFRLDASHHHSKGVKGVPFAG